MNTVNATELNVANRNLKMINMEPKNVEYLKYFLVYMLLEKQKLFFVYNFLMNNQTPIK